MKHIHTHILIFIVFMSLDMVSNPSLALRPPPTQCQTISFQSPINSSCPNPTGSGQNSYPMALPRNVTLISVEPDVTGGGGYYIGSENESEVETITGDQQLQALEADQAGQTAYIVIYSGTDGNLTVEVAVYTYPGSSVPWVTVLIFKNMNWTVSYLKSIAKVPDFVQKVLDAIPSANAKINLGTGPGPGSNPDGSNNAAYIELTGVTVCYGDSGIQNTSGGTITISPDGTVNLGSILVNAQCP